MINVYNRGPYRDLGGERWKPRQTRVSAAAIYVLTHMHSGIGFVQDFEYGAIEMGTRSDDGGANLGLQKILAESSLSGKAGLFTGAAGTAKIYLAPCAREVFGKFLWLLLKDLISMVTKGICNM